MKQLTLKAPFTVKGKGLHTGLEIEATFNPADPGHGYKFRRVDLPDAPVIDALAENVVETTRGTVLQRGDVRVSTVEHALSALYAAGIDNCLIDVNAPEMPILDGSAAEYANGIEVAGSEEQDADKDFFVIKQQIEVRDDTTGSVFLALPYDGFRWRLCLSLIHRFLTISLP